MATHNVLLLLDQIGSGGAAQVVLNLALSLDRDRFSPVVCATRVSPTNGRERLLEEAGIPFLRLNRRCTWDLAPWHPLWRRLPDTSILHSHCYGSNFWGRLWGRVFRVPVVIAQDHHRADDKPLFYRLLDPLLGPWTDGIVTVSEFDRRLSIQVEGHPRSRIVSIHNGIDVSRFETQLSQLEARRVGGLPEEDGLVAVIGRLTPVKNHRGLFRALAALPEDVRSGIRCLVVGSGPLDARLRDYVEERGLQEEVCFLGNREDIAVILRAADVLVLPSYRECLPMVILEALAAGCPIVATREGGIPEVLDGLGWPLVDPHDTPGLANAIVRVLAMSPSESLRIAESGRERVSRKFSREVSALRVEEMYHRLLASKGLQALPN